MMPGPGMCSHTAQLGLDLISSGIPSSAAKEAAALARVTRPARFDTCSSMLTRTAPRSYPRGGTCRPAEPSHIDNAARQTSLEDTRAVSETTGWRPGTGQLE